LNLYTLSRAELLDAGKAIDETSYIFLGGHPEIVGEAGFGFHSEREIPALLNQLVEEYQERKARIVLPTLARVTDRYLTVMGLDRQG
jgi:hypothetical protein